MLLQKDTFSRELEKPESREHSIVFEGMSGIGKSHWSRNIAEAYGYDLIEFDELISKAPEFAERLRTYDGQDGAEKLGSYLGLPDSANFHLREEEYLAVERRLMSQNFAPGHILDMTGSAIYHPYEMYELSERNLVVYLEASRKTLKGLIDAYLE